MATTRVLMPTYNTDPTQLREAVDSLIAQTDESWELVIVDDGSSNPATIAAVEAMPRLDRRIAVRRQANVGPGAARNAAAVGADSEFLLALDADDTLSPTFLELLTRALHTDPAKVVAYPTTRKFGAADETVTGDEYAWDSMVERNLIPVTALVRRSAFEEIGGFDEDMRDGLEDYEFFLRLLKTRHTAAVKVPDAELNYRIQSGSRNDVVNEDLETKYRARGQLIARHGDIYRDRPELIFANELRFRREVLAWRSRYGRLEKLKGFTPLSKRLPHIG